MTGRWKGLQRGGFAMGLVAGLLIGLALALGVALYITKAPVPFVNKVPQRTAEQDTAETERNRSWDPNAPLGGRSSQRPASGAVAGAAAPASAASPAAGMPPTATVAGAAAPAAPVHTPAPVPARDPAAILAGAAPPAAPAVPTRPAAPAPEAAPGTDPFVYFVQAGAFTRSEDAEQQRARLGLLGQSAKVTEREQAGRTVYRVRLGPYPTREEADVLQTRLQEQSVEAQIVRVQKP
jgi:cell division protein FtsN